MSKEKYVIVRCDRSSPFAGILISRKGQEVMMKDARVRRKLYSGETLVGAKARLFKHRLEKHGTYGAEEFFDCALCGVLENRLATLQRLAAKDMPGKADGGTP